MKPPLITNLPLISRRRSIAIIATAFTSASAIASTITSPALGLALNPAATTDANKQVLKELRWQGIVLGADASIILHTHEVKKAKALIIKMLAEVKRLESYFSLYQPHSLISQLNKTGELKNPPAQVYELLSQAMTFAKQSNGAFDPTIQPLFLAYKSLVKQKYNGLFADHPSTKFAQSLINWKNISVTKNKISFKQTDMGLTLNGIAQGYITDKAVDILKNAGYENTLINFGEYHGIGAKPNNASASKNNSWNIQLGSGKPEINQVRPTWTIKNNAIAASDKTGFIFDPDKSLHHMLDPKTGQNQKAWQEIYVMAENATKADAASTALFATAPENIRETFDNMKLEKALLINNNGKQSVYSL